MATKKKSTTVIDHVLIPKHEKIPEKEKKELMDRYQLKGGELPLITTDDPAIQHLDVKKGDIIKISRPSPTAGVTTFYREVAHV